MICTNLICKNSLLVIKQTSHKSKMLINNLIDLCDRLVIEYEREKAIRRQKIISNLNSNTKEHAPTLIRYEESKLSKEVWDNDKSWTVQKRDNNVHIRQLKVIWKIIKSMRMK